MVISRCADCQHSDICKYKDDYEKVIGDITIKVPEPFTLVLNCKHYYSTTCYLTSTYGDSNWAASCSNTIQNLASPYVPGSPAVV